MSKILGKDLGVKVALVGASTDDFYGLSYLTLGRETGKNFNLNPQSAEATNDDSGLVTSNIFTRLDPEVQTTFKIETADGGNVNQLAAIDKIHDQWIKNESGLWVSVAGTKFPYAYYFWCQVTGFEYSDLDTDSVISGAITFKPDNTAPGSAYSAFNYENKITGYKSWE